MNALNLTLKVPKERVVAVCNSNRLPFSMGFMLLVSRSACDRWPLAVAFLDHDIPLVDTPIAFGQGILKFYEKRI
jgi:hypothetical protein